MKIITALLAASLLLAGCSGSSDDEPSPDVTTSVREQIDQQSKDQADQLDQAQDQLADEVTDKADQARRDAGVVVAIDIAGGQVTPQGKRVEVKVGQAVFLDITSDADEEIHVHSDPEHSYDVEPGDSFTKSFTIDTPGQVAVEAHHLDATIVQLVVRP